MNTNHRFEVKSVSEDSSVHSNYKKMGVSESGVPELGQEHATYPAASSDSKIHRYSLAHLTREALPRLDHYRNCLEAIKRPSLGEVHGDLNEEKVRLLYITMNVNMQRQLKENMFRHSNRERDLTLLASEFSFKF
jgi:hypothetical protein